MKNTDKLIFIYFYICQCYDTNLVAHCQRMSNNFRPNFTDQEVLTIFFYCLLVEKRKEIKDIYDFADNYLRSWFPDMVNSYEGFLTRLNNLAPVFPVLCSLLIEDKMQEINPEKFMLYQGLFACTVDSMPIILATGARSFSGKVAPEYCDKSYCASKKTHYYGLKLHVMGFRLFGTLPMPEYVGTTPASHNDLTVFKSHWEMLYNRAIFADKAYGNAAFKRWLIEHNNLHIFTPVKKKKGQKFLEAADTFYSRAVSQIRQPIESFFNWIIEKVGIQKASKVRSEKGLMVHTYGRFAAAMMLLAFDIF